MAKAKRNRNKNQQRQTRNVPKKHLGISRRRKDNTLHSPHAFAGQPAIGRPQGYTTVYIPGIGYVGKPTTYNRRHRRPRLTTQELKEIAEESLFSRAIEKISNGVVNMEWVIKPPAEKELDEDDIVFKIDQIKKSLQQPSGNIHDTYTKLIKAVVRDLLVFGVAALERQTGNIEDEQDQAFWLWPLRVEFLYMDSEWDASFEGLHPRAWYCPPTNDSSQYLPIYNQDFFIIQSRASSYEDFPPSPVQLAYHDMTTWLGLHDYQSETVENAVRDYMIGIEDEDEEGVEIFREYWETEVLGKGRPAIFGGKVDVIKFGARNDQELFPEYCKYLTGLILLEFGLNLRDGGYLQDANYATAGVAADASFQEAILPLARIIINHLHLKAVDHFYPGYSLSLADVEPRNETDEANRATMVYEKNLASQNEARGMIGLSDIPGGNLFSNGNKIEDSAEDIQERQAQQQAPPQPPGQVPVDENGKPVTDEKASHRSEGAIAPSERRIAPTGNKKLAEPDKATESKEKNKTTESDEKEDEKDKKSKKTTIKARQLSLF